jgi:hypothetical protein
MEGRGIPLRRVVELAETDEAQQGSFNWILTLAVVGQAGAVSLDVRVGGHRCADERALLMEPQEPEAPPKIFAAEYWSGGIMLHGYRPIAGGSAAPAQCGLLHDGRCYGESMFDPERDGKLIARLSNPGGQKAVFEHLEGVYWAEFVPSLSPEQIAARERRRGEELAEARLEGEPEFVRAAPDAEVELTGHEISIHDVRMSAGERFWAICSCQWRGVSSEARADAVGDAEAHIATQRLRQRG